MLKSMIAYGKHVSFPVQRKVSVPRKSPATAAQRVDEFG